MAGEAALVLKMEARLRDFERQMDRAAQKANASAKAIEQRFSRINPKSSFAKFESQLGGMIPIAGRLGAALSGVFSVAALGQAAQTFTKVQNQLRATGLAGEQLASVYRELFDAAQRQGQPLESVVQLYSRLSLAQGQLGVTSQQLIGFTESIAQALRVQGTDATQASGALLQLSQALGGGVVRAEEFNSILEGMPVVAQAVANGITEAGGSIAKLRELVNDGLVSSKAFFDGYAAGSREIEQRASETTATVGQATERLKNAFIQLAGQFDATVGVTSSLASGMNSLASSITNVAAQVPSAIEQLRAFRKEWGLVNEDIGQQVGLLGVLGKTIQKLPEPKPATGGSRFSSGPSLTSVEEIYRRGRGPAGPIQEGRGAAGAAAADVKLAEQIYRASGERLAKEIAANVPPKVSVNDPRYAVAAKGGGGGGGRRGGGGGGGGSTSPDEFARELQQLQRRTELLNIEAQTVGKSTFEAEKAKAAFDLLNAAKEAGIPISSQLQQQIEAEAAKYAEAAAQLEQTRQKIDELNAFSEEFGSALSNAFVDAIVNGEELGQVLENLLKQLATMAINSAFQQLFGAPAGGGLSPFASIFAGLFGGARAAGGPVAGGRTYLVGEKGPELFTPGRSGMITPNSAMRAGGGQGAVVVTVAPVFESGATPDMVRAVPEIRKVAVAAVKEAMTRRDF